MAAATLEKSPARFVRAFRFFLMELVEEPVEGRRNNDAETREERQAAEQRVTAGKNLAAIGLQRRHRPHPGQNHRRIDEGIHPRHWLKGPVTNHANAERERDDQQTDARAPRQTRVKFPAWQQRF